MSTPRARLRLRTVAAATAVALLSMTAGCAHLVFKVLDPGEVFEAASVPPAPDYTSPAAWAALPTLVDNADVALPELPSVDQENAPADVFFVHTTTWLGDRWNAAFDDPGADEGTALGSLLIQASAFNGCCAVWAPRYRQVNGKALTEPSDAGQLAVEVAYGDVKRAFAYFLEQRPAGRPFILASHSQGSTHAVRLLRERVKGNVLDDLVAAYLIGGPLGEAELGDVPVCDAPDDVGCAVGFNARSPDFEPNALEFQSPLGPRWPPMAGRLCVNPITWRTNGRLALPHEHGGAIFFDTETPRLLPQLLSAQCEGGTLVVRGLGELPKRRLVDDALLQFMGKGNYHPIEYQLFYVDLRKNAQTRLAALMRSRARPTVDDGAPTHQDGGPLGR